VIDSIDALPRRLADKIMPEPMTGCWLWIGATSKGGRCGGYGSCWDRGKVRQAHRVVYEAASGKRLRRSTTLDHVRARGCASIVCCNPAHLEPVSRATNNRRSSCHHRRGPGGRFV
jgi:hypothetical protein